MVTIKNTGKFKKADKYFEKLLNRSGHGNLDKYGRMGVEALESATPVDTGLTAASWTYEIIRGEGKTKIVWKNDNINRGINIALLIQYGHATKDGAFIEGVDYINPALKPIFDKMTKDVWREVTEIE